jgi:hypothetical protein
MNIDDILSEKKKETAKASTVMDGSASFMRLRPKSGEFIEINYDDLATFLKKNLNRTFTKTAAKKFAESLRDFLGLYTDAELDKKKEKEEAEE